MDELTLLANALMALDDKLAACMKCGMCQSVCPVFGETMMEADVTRGKLTLLEKLAHRLIEDPDAVNEKLNRCLLCGSCQANCPSGVSILEIFMEARAIVAAYKGLFAPQEGHLPYPVAESETVRFPAEDRRSFPRAGHARRQQRAGHRHVFPAAASVPRRTPHAAPRQADPQRQDRRGELPAGKSRCKVAFFPGCMGDKIFTNVSEACLKVFDYHEVGVYLPTNYSCCGIPALSSGDLEGFEKMVMHNVDVLKEGSFDLIVTPCSSCTETIRSLWPKMAGKMPYKYRDAINELSQKAMDINAFLVDVLKVKPRASGRHGQTKVTYHESCHLLRSLGVSAQPRELIRMNPDYDLVEMKEADRCCGCGGSFTLSHYDLSRKIGQRKRDNIVASGAEVVATGCPACMMQLSDMLAHNGDSVTVKHTIEIYADSLKREPPAARGGYRPLDPPVRGNDSPGPSKAKNGSHAAYAAWEPFLFAWGTPSVVF